MMLCRVLCIIAFVGFIHSRYFIVGPAKIRVLGCDPCKEYPNLPIQFIVKSRMFNESTQLLDAFWVLPVDIDDNVTMSVKCSRIDKRKTQVNSFTLNDVEACSTMTKYVGELWTYIQTQIGMEAGVCPIKMGNYSTENMILDLTKLNVQMILEGRFKTRILLKQFSNLLYCADFTIELSPKN